MDILTQLLTFSNIMLCLAIVAIVWVQRKGAEVFTKRVFKKDLKESKLWTEFFMPIGPLGTGALLTLISQLPVPEMFNGGLLVRMVFGVGLGLVSGLVFRLIKKNIYEKMGKKEEKTPYE
jgi:hypothetical protein